MTVSAQKRTEIENRRRMVAQLYLRKVTQEEIAQKLGISQPTVSRDIYYLSQRWQQEALGDMDGRRGRELAELEEMERDCAMQFANAKDMRWLSQRLRVKERIAKMLGLDTQIARMEALNIDVSKLTMGQLERIAKGEDPIAVLATSG